MEKRLIVAVLLMSAALLVTNILFPPPPPETEAGVDSVTAVPAAARPEPAPSLALPTLPADARAPADTVVVSSELFRYGLSTRGASVVRAELLEFPSYTQEGPVQLAPEGAGEFVSLRLLVGGDTVDLSSLPFGASAGELRLADDQPQTVSFVHGEEGGFGAVIEYTFRPGDYLIDVRGRLTGLGGRQASLLTELGPGLAPHEAFEHHSEQQLAAVTRVPGDVNRIRLSRIEGVQTQPGRFTWAGIKDKYFLAAVIAGDEFPFQDVVLRRLSDHEQHFPEEDRSVALPRAELSAGLPLAQDGSFAYQIYIGPQDFGRLRAAGHDLENVTQYAYRWLEPVIRPVAALILWVLESLHDTLGVAYGWVLVLFGVLMRLVLWPLNAKAMRAQMKNMAVQPLMAEIREKYKNDPQAQQQEMMRLYKEHGFNPFAGCLPLLVPFPVLITLFFVFQNTISFRGADFLWLPDLSLRDPIFILPVFLVLSMFALQWVSVKMSGMEENPQMKMMMYVMPVMMGVLFFSLPAGLNLYYATTNIASIPQQVLIARERKRAQEEAKKNAPKLAPTPAPKRKKGKG